MNYFKQGLFLALGWYTGKAVFAAVDKYVTDWTAKEEKTE